MVITQYRSLEFLSRMVTYGKDEQSFSALGIVGDGSELRPPTPLLLKNRGPPLPFQFFSY
jgi:hypothetical protein